MVKQFLLFAIFSVVSCADYEVVYQWSQIDYDYPDDYVPNSEGYIPENNALTGIKIYGDRMFLTVPRAKEGVPFTLNWVPKEPTPGETSPKLRPFPSWQAQEIGNCSALQFVHSMEIDPLGRMWVADVGRRNTNTQPDNTCPPKLVIYDLENDNAIVATHVFPDDVAPQNSSHMNDLVIDTIYWHAYISDSDEAALIVYSLAENNSWRIKDPTMLPDNDGGAIDGIALSSRSDDHSTLYYCPIDSNNFYSIPTNIVNNPPSDNVSEYVNFLGSKPIVSRVDGLAMDNQNVLYYGLLDTHAVASWNTSVNLSDGQVIIAEDATNFDWPDTFGFDDSGYLWVVVPRHTNKLENYASVNLDDINYRVIKIYVDALSYMHD